MDKIFDVYLAKAGQPESDAYAKLALPASPYQVQDALDKLRLSEGETMYWEITECYTTEEWSSSLNENYGLYELNDLAQKLSGLSRDPDLTLKQPDYAILLEVSKGFFNDPSYDGNKTVRLKLPATPDTLDNVLTALDIWDWREVGWSCLDCKVPVLMDMISENEDGIDFLNGLARQLADMDPKTLKTYKALLALAKCGTLPEAKLLVDTLDHYILSPRFSSPIEIARGELSVTLSDSDAEILIPHLNLHQYGQALLQHYGGVLTDYGLIERTDDQPVLSMLNQPQRGGMEMT